MARRRGLSDEQLLALLNGIDEDQSEGEYVDGISTDSDYDAKRSMTESSNESEISDEDSDKPPRLHNSGNGKK